jgi:hypothetical protein
MMLLADFTVIYPDYSGLIIILGILIASLIFLMIGLIDLFTRDFKDNSERIFWLIAIILTAGFATPFYLFKRRNLIKG